MFPEGGGLIMAFRNQLSATQLDLSSKGFDSLTSIDVVGAKFCFEFFSFFLFVLYIQPRCTVDEY